MPLFVGLGNPGPEHAANRHNLGFLAVDTIALRHNAAPWRRRFQGEFCEASIGRTHVQLLKPLTYMNEAGRSVQEAVQFYKLAANDVVVFHDELDLAPAKLRVKTGGGNAGHNGLRSVSAHIGNEYRRVRLGIGHPGVKDIVHHWVLSNFAKADRDWVIALCDAIADNADLLADGQDASFQNKVHLALDAKGFSDLPATARGRPD